MGGKKITDRQRAIYARYYCGRVQVFVLNEMIERGKWGKLCVGRELAHESDRIDKKTAQALYRKGHCEYVDVRIVSDPECPNWYGIRLTDQGKARARLLGNWGRENVENISKRNYIA